jgi:hypothetical protein
MAFAGKHPSLQCAAFSVLLLALLLHLIHLYMKYFLFLLCISTLLFACQQKASNEKANQFAVSIHAATTGNIRASQQAFVDKMTETLRAVKQNPSVAVDTKTLRELLDKAKDANHISLVALNKITEVDNTINLKEKAIADNELNRSLFEHEFSSIIDVLESTAANKMTTLDSVITAFAAKETAIKSIRKTAQDASYDFDKKYDVIVPADGEGRIEKAATPKK